MKPNQHVTSVLKASEILICVCRGERKLSNIARKLKYNKTSVFRILNSLAQKGLVVKDPLTRSYYPGPFLQNLSIDTSRVHDVLAYTAADEMEALCHALDETVSLVVAYESLWLVVKVIHSYQKLTFSSVAGKTGPIYTGALGKVLLAQLPKHELNDLLNKIKLTAYTETTTIDKLKLIHEVTEIRRQGYAVTIGEYEEGGSAIGVPIRHYSHPVALCVIGFETSLSKKTELVLEQLKNSQEVIESRLQTIAVHVQKEEG